MFCSVHTCAMSEPSFEHKGDVLCPIYNVLTCVTHEYKMCSVRTYGTYEKFVRNYVTRKNLIF